jgi:hypothetical protein
MNLAHALYASHLQFSYTVSVPGVVAVCAGILDILNSEDFLGRMFKASTNFIQLLCSEHSAL